MNEKDSQNLEYIRDYLYGEEDRQRQNNEYLGRINSSLKELVYFRKEFGGTPRTLSKILEELEKAKSERNYQLFFLGLIMISVAKMAFG